MFSKRKKGERRAEKGREEERRGEKGREDSISCCSFSFLFFVCSLRYRKNKAREGERREEKIQFFVVLSLFFGSLFSKRKKGERRAEKGREEERRGEKGREDSISCCSFSFLFSLCSFVRYRRKSGQRRGEKGREDG